MGDGGGGQWVNPDGVAPSWMVSVSASVNLPLHHKVQKFSCGTGSPGWSQKKGRKTVAWCGKDPTTTLHYNTSVNGLFPGQPG